MSYFGSLVSRLFTLFSHLWFISILNRTIPILGRTISTLSRAIPIIPTLTWAIPIVPMDACIVPIVPTLVRAIPIPIVYTTISILYRTTPSLKGRSPSFTGRPHPLQDDPHPNEQSLCRRVCCQSLTMIWPIWHWQHRHMQKTVWNQWIASANISKWLWPDVSIWHLLIMEIDKHLTSDICQSDQEFLNVTYVNTYTNPWQLSVDLVVWP